MAHHHLNLNAPSDEAIAAAQRVLKAKPGSKLALSDAKLLAREVLRFDDCCEQIQQWVAKFNAAKIKELPPGEKPVSEN